MSKFTLSRRRLVAAGVAIATVIGFSAASTIATNAASNATAIGKSQTLNLTCSAASVDLAGYTTPKPGAPAVTHTEWYWTQTWWTWSDSAPTDWVSPLPAGSWTSDGWNWAHFAYGWTFTTSGHSINAPQDVGIFHGKVLGSGWEKGAAETVTDTPAVDPDPTPNHVTVTLNGSQVADADFGATYHWDQALSGSDDYNLSVTVSPFDGPSTSYNKSVSSCLTRIPVPDKPTANAPTCESAGTLYVPANTDEITWSADPDNAKKVVATVKPGYLFKNGKSTKTYTETFLPQLGGDDCASDVSASIGASGNDATCAVTVPTITFTPVDGVEYSTTETAFVAGETVHVLATADATHKFVSGELPDGWSFQDSHHATFTVTFAAAPDCTAVPTTPTFADSTCVDHQPTSPSVSLPANADHITYTWWFKTNDNGFQVKATMDPGYSWGDLSGTGWQDKGLDGNGNAVAAYHHTWGATPDCNVYVTPDIPQLSETCEVNGDGDQTGNVLDDIALPLDTTDVHYAKHDGKLFAVIKQSVKAYTFFQTLPRGWAFNDGAKHQYLVFTPTYTNPTCLIDTAPVNPTVNQAVCTGPGTHGVATVVPAATPGVTYTVAQDLSSVTATLQAGYEWQKGLPNGWASGSENTLVYTVALTSPGACLVGVAPQTVTAQAGTCDTTTGFDSPAAITSPTDGLDEGGITYHVAGLTVTATADSGYDIAGTDGWVNGDGLWTYTASVTQPFCPSVVALPDSVPSPTGALTGVPGTTNPGQQLNVTGTGFAPGATVNFGIYSTPKLLATVTADASGIAKATIVIPADFTGDHTVVAAGSTPAGAAAFLTAKTTVVTKTQVSPGGSGHGVGGVSTSRGPGVAPNGGSSSGLANTGTRLNPIALTQIALLAMLAGAGLLVATRRRARKH